MPVGATSAGTTDVIGNVKRTGPFVTGTAYSFGNPFNSIAFTVRGHQADRLHRKPAEGRFRNSPAFPGTSVSRTYAISASGGSGFSATLRLHYLTGELNGLTKANFQLWKAGVSWAAQGRTGSVNTTDHWAELSGVTSFSNWTLAVKANQTITVTTAAPASAVYGSTFPVAATSSSGLAVAITATGGCSGSGSGSATISMTSGTVACVVHYNQPGNGDYNPAPEVTSSTTGAQKALNITAANQTKTYG